MEAQESLIATLETFSKSREMLKDVYKTSKVHFEALKTILHSDGKEEDISEKQTAMFLSPEDELYMDKTVNKNPVIIVSGKVNCGKSSLVNELLGGNHVPTSLLPCTARLVHIKYSDRNYLTVCDENNPDKNMRQYFEDKVPSEHINLKNQKRKQRTESGAVTVVIGLKHDLLKHGLEIVDVPGLCENKELNKIMDNCLDGVLQLLIYILDGKEGLRGSDTEFLCHLDKKIPHLKVIYACNKIERDRNAEEMDKFSDSEEDNVPEDGSDDFCTNPKDEIHINRAKEVFDQLLKTGLILKSRKYEENMDDFHGISCNSIKNARSNNESNFFTEKFQSFVESVIKRFNACVNEHLARAVEGLLRCQRELYDFFISDKMLKSPNDDILKTIDRVEEKEINFNKTMKDRVRTRWANLIKEEIERRLEYIGMETMEEVKSRMGNEDSGLTAREFVLRSLTEGIAVQVKQIEGWLKTDLINQRAKPEHIFRVDSSLLQNHLSTFLHTGETVLDFDKWKLQWKSDLRNDVEGISLDKKNVIETASEVIENINTNNTTEHIVNSILVEMNKHHDGFMRSLRHIRALCKYKDGRSTQRQKTIRDLMPDYVRNICLTEALLTTLKKGAVKLGDRLNPHVSRMEVYACEEWLGDKNLIGKKITDMGQPQQQFCQPYLYTNIIRDPKYLAQVTALVFDTDWDFVILQERFDGTLYDLLTSNHELSLSTRVEMCYHLAEMCSSVAKCNIRLNDLRINNFLYRKTKEGVQTYFNSSKWKDLDIPYPDGGSAFHFAPEILLSDVKQKQTKFDAYSMSVLLLFLVIGKFERPAFSAPDGFLKKSKQSDNENAQAKDDLACVIRGQFIDILDRNWTGSKDGDFYLRCKAILNECLHPSPYLRMDIDTFVTDVKYLLTISKGNTSERSEYPPPVDCEY